MKNVFKVTLGVIALLFLISVVAGAIGSDKTSPAVKAPAGVHGPVVVNEVTQAERRAKRKAAKIMSLTLTGDRVSKQIAEIATLGQEQARAGQADAVCTVTVPAMIRKVGRLGRIVNRIGDLTPGARIVDVEAFSKGYLKLSILQGQLSGYARQLTAGCAQMGYR